MFLEQVYLLLFLLSFVLTINTGREFAGPVTLNKGASRHLFVAGDTDRSLFSDEFITKEVTNDEQPRKWIISVLNNSFFAKRAEDMASFSGKIRTHSNRFGFRKDVCEEYYHVFITQDFDGFYDVSIDSLKPQSSPPFTHKVALDDKVPLLYGVSSTVRELLRLPQPRPLFSYDNPLICHNGSVYSILGTLEGFRPEKIPSNGRDVSINTYLVSYVSHKQKAASFILEPNGKITLYAYNKCKNKYRPQKIQIKLKTLLDKKDVFKIKIQEPFEELRIIDDVTIPSYILAKSANSRRFLVLYKPVRTQKNSQPTFSNKIRSIITSMNAPVTIRGISQLDGRLQKVGLTYLELSGGELEDGGGYEH